MINNYQEENNYGRQIIGNMSTSEKVFFLFICLFVFDCIGSSLLHSDFSSCSEQGLLFIVVHGPLIAVASLVAEHRL